jgi:hypothetical protein
MSAYRGRGPSTESEEPIPDFRVEPGYLPGWRGIAQRVIAILFVVGVLATLVSAWFDGGAPLCALVGAFYLALGVFGCVMARRYPELLRRLELRRARRVAEQARAFEDANEPARVRVDAAPIEEALSDVGEPIEEVGEPEVLSARTLHHP